MHLTSDHHHRGERRLRWVLALTCLFLLVEVAGGILSRSLALLSDAGHMLADVSALIIALLAARHARRPPDRKRTYGYSRLEVLAALGNGLLLALLAGGILREAWTRLSHPLAVRPQLMLVVAVAGLLVNLAGLWFLRHERHHNLNLRAAFLHVAGDALGSVGTIVSGVLIWWTGYNGIDALASILISLLILWGAARLVRESLNYLLEGAPREIPVAEVDACLRRFPGVVEIHDLHLWRISSGMDVLTAHVVLEHPGSWREVLQGLRSQLKERFGLTHATLQLEGREDRECDIHEGEICDQPPWP
jgi:cobalt-zinc-cadmium efflux system protein